MPDLFRAPAGGGQRPAEVAGWWRKAHEKLAGMKKAGMFLSPEDEKALEELRRKVGEKPGEEKAK